MRWIVAALLAANLVFYAWSQGAFEVFGQRPASFGEREPQRLGQQVRPEMLQIRRVDPARP